MLFLLGANTRRVLALWLSNKIEKQLNRTIKMIKSFQLPLQFDTVELQADLEKLLSKKWLPHYNTNDYTGNWNGLALRSPNGNPESIYPNPSANIEYDDTPLMAECPSIKKMLHTFQCQIESVRLLKLEAGAVIKTHRDFQLAFEENIVRLHIPIITNKDVEFTSDGSPIEMKEGQCWYINAALPHSAKNNGATDRIHLVIDCVVNDWVRGFFPKIEKIHTSNGTDSIKKSQDFENMISALREMSTPTSLALVEQLLNDRAEKHFL